MGANYSTSYVKSTASAFLMAQKPSQSRLHQYGEDGIETRGYSKLTGFLKKYVECIEFVVKNPTQLHVKMNELAHIRTNIRELMNQYKVPESFTDITYGWKFSINKNNLKQINILDDCNLQDIIKVINSGKYSVIKFSDSFLV